LTRELGEVGKISPQQRRSWPAASLLGKLRGRTRDGLLAAGVIRRYPAGRTIMVQGEPASHVLLLLSGWVKVIGADASGDTALLAIRSIGDLIGEMGVLDKAPRSATVVAATELVTKQISATELAGFLSRHPDAAVQVASVISERFRWANRRRIEFATCTAEVRVARLLIDLCAAHGWANGDAWEFDIALTREELASMAGIALSTAEKIVRTFAREGLVSSRYRALTITDMRGLRFRAKTA
jgi:CRP/FNR family cyclic AMP-dependent transcriptional regulator